jgi:hypothetical protein
LDPIFAFVEGSTFATWIRGEVPYSTYVFPVVVTLHTLGMGFLAGGSAAIALRILGVAPRVPIAPMARFLPLIWFAFAVMAVSGVLLLIGYPTKAFTNPIFYLKLCLIALAIWLVHRIAVAVLRSTNVDPQPGPRAKALALASLLSWIALIAAGRLLAYTHRWEMLGVPALT